MNNLLLFFVLSFFTILQISFFSYFNILNQHYEILFALTIFIGIKCSWYEGGITGIFAGFLNDVFSIAPFGSSIFIYSISGFIVAFFENFIFTQHISTRLFILFVMSIFNSFLSLTIINGIHMIFEIWNSYKLTILTIASINTICSIPVYIMLDKITYDHEF